DRVAARPNLNLGFLVGRDHEIPRPERLALPAPVIQVQHAAGLLGEQGIASVRSQRQIVTPEMWATSPAASTWRRSSARLKRESGSPNLLGSSHAIAFTRATSRGGKTRGPTSARAFLQASESFS